MAVVLVVIALNRPNTRFTAADPVAAPAQGDPSIPGTPVKVSLNGCGVGWTGGHAGPQTFALWNPDPGSMEVYLQNVATGKVFFDQEAIGPGSTRAVSVTMPAGTYRFYCNPEDGQGLVGEPETVTGSYAGATTPQMTPVLNGDLFGPVKRYHAWVAGRFPTLQRQVTALDADVRGGDLAQAKRDWLAGHLTYETLGAAYNAFGADNDAINAMPSSSTPAAKDTSLQGFHKIEALLWGGAPASAITPYTGRLVTAVAKLSKDFAASQIDTSEIGLRAHEILENTLQFTLNGYDDAGSHTSLATLDANVTGTLAVLKQLRHVLASRDTHLAATYRWVHRTQRLARSYDHAGTWTPLQSLTTRQREQLNATVSQTVEYLSQVAAITTPRGLIGK